jgi:rhomboid protease GluP
MLGLYFFGKNLEEETNKQWMIGIFFASGLLGNLVFMFTSASPVVGASGAVFGILGASMLLNPTKTIHIYLFPLPLGLIAVLFIIAESLVAYFQPSAYANIATVAHLAGLATGSIFAFFYKPKKAVEGFFILLLCFLLLVILGPIFALITGIGGVVLQLMDSVIGFFLYGLAKMLSFIWL